MTPDQIVATAIFGGFMLAFLTFCAAAIRGDRREGPLGGRSE